MSDSERLCLTRREALVTGACSFAAGLALPSAAQAQTRTAALTVYPVKKIIRLKSLKEGEPVAFTYPLEEQPNFIVKLGAPAQGGVGPDRDIVAFSALCTHMGGSLRGRYRHDLKAIGPCPFHFSTFDLTKGGIPVHASATQNLPQVILRVEGEDIVAVGVTGLIYGFRHNLKDGTLAKGATPRRASVPSPVMPG